MTEPTSERPAGRDRPNIVLFLTDDHAAWAMGSAGNSGAPTPVLDELASGGTRFVNAFTPSPVCSPARACLLTGLTPSQVGIHDWIDEELPEFGDADWLHGIPTLARLLADAGYRCGLSGKWHLGRSDRVPDGYDWCFGLPYGQGGHRGWNAYHRNGRLEPADGVKTDIFTDEAIGFLDSVTDEQPFFLQVGYVATHSPWAGHDPGPVDPSGVAPFTAKAHPLRRNEGFPHRYAGPGEAADRTAQYYAAVAEIDRGVGRILDTLRQQDRLDSTIVVYTSDHGMNLGQHGFWGKGNGTRPLNMYEQSIRVPLIWSGPDVERGTSLDGLVDHYDTFTTLLDRAGAGEGLTRQRQYPGRSYREALTGAAMATGRTVFGEYGDLRMARSERHKLIARHGHGADELYDLVADPDEQHNVIDAPDAVAVRDRLRAELEDFYSDHDDPQFSGLQVRELRQHNLAEAWRDGLREIRTPERDTTDA